MKQFDLSSLEWSLRGWHPWHWRIARTMEMGHALPSHVGPVTATVPGSVQKALLEAKIIPDWNVRTNSLSAEWVENRHWTFETVLPLVWCRQAGRKVLHCEGLDHAGEIWCGTALVGTFMNAFVPYEFDLTDAIAQCLSANPGCIDVPLVFAFTDAPRYLGQVNFTSHIRDWKPRFYYIWDWTIRLVQIGIWDAVHLKLEEDASIVGHRAFTEFDETSYQGRVQILGKCDGNGSEYSIEAKLLLNGKLIAQSSDRVCADNDYHLEIAADDVDAWWPIGMGEQSLYELKVELKNTQGEVVDERAQRVGFRHIEWKPCKNAPADAEPWVLHVNGKPLFILGANWVPIRPNFADVTDDQYRKLIDAYATHGFNFLRVWGGAQMEKEIFYQLCDEKGILIWQEFPFSSSGIDNWPPEDAEICRQAASIAASYIARRQHHPSLIMWCGGNELQFGMNEQRVGAGIPLGYDHPPLAAMHAVVKRMDPTRRFVPTSSSGPRFSADPKDFGKGLHHDVHGPWNLPGTMEEWKAYWDHDDALFRSEVGVPAASSAEIIRDYCQDEGLPGDLSHPAWRHVAGWWIQWKSYLEEGGDPTSLDGYVSWSQQRQAIAISYVINACFRRFPECGGVIVWMGHDCFPCPVNTSIFDFHGKPKHAAVAIAALCRRND